MDLQAKKKHKGCKNVNEEPQLSNKLLFLKLKRK